VRGVPTEPKRAHAEKRLRDEKIAWLTTVRRDGQPQSSPVWFLWRDAEIVLYSRPMTQKVRNVRANRWVAVHLRDLDDGADIVSIEGEALIDEGYPSAAAIPAYVKKYDAMIADLRMTRRASRSRTRCRSASGRRRCASSRSKRQEHDMISKATLEIRYCVT
jgi:PPOX class probable F420-dependent enzyme